jgi:hypothetical protein
MLLWIGVCVLGLAVVSVNATVTRRVWRSGIYERRQLIAQTTLIWLLPGAALVVAAILKDEAPRRAPDPTASNPDTPNGNAASAAGSIGAP